ncbi:hypothetical protein [Deinococcus navajonensis]|uniref:Phage holin family protein n=1 Tax=Deinococcus navajonensis TaxID=309884 RepID=A0ABV8XUQ1_9DEIO
MSKPTVEVPNFGEMFWESFREQRQDAIEMVAGVLRTGISDLGEVLSIGVLLVICVGAIVYALFRRDFAIALLCIILAAFSGVVAYQVLSTASFTWGSVALGAMLVLGAVSKGWRGVARLARLID